MKCALCGKAMFTAAAWAAGYPIGPKCARRAGMTQPKRKQKTEQATRVEDGQSDLFENKNASDD